MHRGTATGLIEGWHADNRHADAAAKMMPNTEKADTHTFRRQVTE